MPSHASLAPAPQPSTRDLALDAAHDVDEHLDALVEAGRAAVPDYARFAWDAQCAVLRATFDQTRALLRRLARRDDARGA